MCGKRQKDQGECGWMTGSVGKVSISTRK